jgi:NADH-quinone oxidoreductase subunit E
MIPEELRTQLQAKIAAADNAREQVCWMFHEGSLFDYLCQKLGVCAGEVSADGMFTVLPTACIGFCDQAPAMVVNGRFFGNLTPESIDEILEQLKSEPCDLVLCR